MPPRTVPLHVRTLAKTLDKWERISVVEPS
jgi:hypothetical protein